MIRTLIYLSILGAGIAMLAQAQTQTLGLNLNATATPAGSAGVYNIVNSGTATLNRFGTATVSGAAQFNTSSPSTPAPETLSLTFSPADTLTGTLLIPPGLVIPVNPGPISGNVSFTITSGTGVFAGATGTFPLLTGSGTVTCRGGAQFDGFSRAAVVRGCPGFFDGAFQFSGNGTLSAFSAPAPTPAPASLVLVMTALAMLFVIQTLRPARSPMR